MRSRVAAVPPAVLARLAGAVGPALRRTLALVAALALLGAATPAFAQETEHWSATLTRGDTVGGSGRHHGYVRTGLTGAGGTLSPSTITYDSVDYTVNRLYVSTDDFVVFQTTPALPTEDLVLRIPTLKRTATTECPADGTEDLALADTESGQDPNYWSDSTYSDCLDESGWAADLTTTVTVKLIGTVSADNATGAPTISGADQVGGTLTAATDGIADTDGLTSPAYTYQWIRVTGDTEADIASATSSTYTLVAADAGKAVKVKVSFTDDTSNAETLTSTAFPAGGTIRPTGCAAPYLAGREQIWSGAVTPAAFSSAGRSYHGYSSTTNPDTGALTDTGFTTGSGTDYTVNGALVEVPDGELLFALGSQLTAAERAVLALHVCGEDFAFGAAGNLIGGAYKWPDAGFDWSSTPLLTLFLSEQVGNATGAPTVSGTAQVGETLTSGVSAIDDPDGLTTPTFAYQWVRVDADGTSNPVDIAGATSSTYTLAAADAGKRIRVKVSFTDDDGNAELRASAAYPSSGTVFAAVSADLLWSATMTVGTTANTRANGYYVDGGLEGPDNVGFLVPYGTLTDDEFSHGTPAVDYVVKSVRWGTDLEEGSGSLFFVPDAALSATAKSSLILQIGLHKFPLANATVSSGRKYKWSGAYTTTVPPPRNSMTSVCLRTSTQVCSVAVVPDTAAPQFTGATVNGASLVLNYNEELDTGSLPAITAFTVTVGGSARTVSGVSVTLGEVGLRIAPSVAAGEAVTVAYAKPATNPVQDVVGNEAASLTVQNASNTTVDADLVCTAPDLAGSRQIWTATATLATSPGGAINGFDEGPPAYGELSSKTVMIGSNSYTITQATVDLAEQMHFISPAPGLYTDPAQKAKLTLYVCDRSFPLLDTATGNFRDTGLDWRPFATRTLTLGFDDVAPTLSDAVVDGTSLVLTYNEDLDESSTPATSAYSVTVGSATAAAPTNVAVAGRTVTLTLATAAVAPDTVTVVYTVPSTNPVQDVVGNDAAAIAATRTITNRTGNRAPVFADATLTRSITENSAGGANVGAVVPAATDADTGDTLTYSLEGTDEASFGFNATTRQITARSGVDYDYEGTRTYSVTVKVTDRAGDTDTVDVTINVTNLPGFSIAPQYERILLTDGRVRFVLTADTRPSAEVTFVNYTATQDEAWLAAENLQGFLGHISEEAVNIGGPDFKPDAPARSGNVTFTLQPGDGYELGATTSATVAIVGADPLITVRATQAAVAVDEDGGTVTVTLSAETIAGAPEPRSQEVAPHRTNWAAMADTATGGGVDFQDAGGVAVFNDTNFTKQGARWVATGDVQVTVVDDGTWELDETFHVALSRHTNLHRLVKLALANGTLCTANPSAVCGATVTIAANDNTAPAFADDSTTREVEENSPPGTAVGDAVTATDADIDAGADDELTYSLEGADAASFDIDAGTGRIETVAGVTYDYEGTNSYSVTVKATDLQDGSDTVDVAIALTDVASEGPEVGDAAVNGLTVTLTFDTALDDAHVPATDAFTVTVDGTAVAVTDVRVAGSAVILTLARAVTDREAVEVDYEPPATNALRDANGREAPAFGGRKSVNKTPDRTVPALDGTPSVYATELRLTYDEPLDETSTPATGAFTVEVNGAPVAVARVTVAGVRVRLTLAAPVLPGQTVTVTYVPPGSNPIQDGAGNAAAALVAEAVDNSSTDAVQGDLRLVDGLTDNEGRLEIFAVDPNAGADERPQWGTVCDDRFTSWSAPRGSNTAEPNRASFVACRILGYEGGEFVSGHDIFSRDSLEDTPIWLDDVRCLAGDPAHKAGDGDSPVSLLDCHHAGLALHNCAHTEDVAVRCTGTLGDPANQGPGLTFGAVDADGRGIVLTFDEPLDADPPPATGAFVVSGDGVLNAVTRVEAPGTGGLGANELRLGVERVIEPGERVDVIYSDPSDGDDAAAIQDDAGVDGPSFHRKVANDRAAGGQNPVNGGQNSPVEGPVTASFTDVPAAHDGETGIALRIALDAALSTSWTGVRDALAVSGGTLTRVHRVDGRSDLWGVEVTPSGAADLTVRLNASPACGDPATTMCTADGRRVETAIETTVPGPEEAVDATPLTVSVSDMPAEHGGADAVFTFRLTFSETLASSYSYETMRDRSLGVWQGEHLRATNARRLEPPGNRYWEITITPIDAQDIAITLGPTFECTDNGAMCTEDGRKLSNAFTRLVRGPTPNGIVGGDALSMTWPSPRDGFGSPSATDFAVRVDGAPRAVTAAALAGRTAMLLLAAPVAAGDTVTVGYLGSAMHPLADASGIVRSAPWFDLAVENVTGTETPVAAPDAEQRPDDPLAAAADGTRVLDASGLGLTDLAGVARLAALTRLDLSGNAVADLAPLAGLTALRDLDLADNRVADLGPLSALHGLERLDLSRNAVTDLSPLAGLPHLAVLVLDGNAVADLGPLTHLGRLEQLGLAGNAVLDVTPLQDLATLRRLDLSGNALGDLSPLGDVGALVWLALPGEAVAGAPALGRLTALRWVWLDRGGVDDARVAPGTVDGRR